MFYYLHISKFFRNFDVNDIEVTSSRKKKQTSLFCSSLVFS